MKFETLNHLKGADILQIVNLKKLLNIKMYVRIKYVWLLQKLKIYYPTEIYYIGGSEALPPPLTADEENYLISKLDERDFAVKTILIERNLRLVVYIARKFENTGVGVEDLISIGTIGLIKAINTFNPDKNIKLATYASRCIENEILMFLRKNNTVKSEISIDEPLNVDWDGNELLLSDILGTDNDIIYRSIEDEVDKELLTIAMKKLSAREKKIMELRFGLQNGVEKTQKEVADMLGISQSYISRLEKRIISRLKKEISRMI
ncbi:MAG: polymerase sporulation-specific sigma factor [Clostridiales bacterium]|nr:polymerase sporulation-specific sigma factor [Clostridiales bacterium]MDK2932747.1 polymerase sporulation-specific sigma factor [Clostridiales bacterium]